MSRLSVKAFAIAFGTMSAVYVLYMGWAAALGHRVGFVAAFSSHYPGFDASFVGGLVGATFGFVDGAMTGGVIALVHNAVVKRL